GDRERRDQIEELKDEADFPAPEGGALGLRHSFEPAAAMLDRPRVRRLETAHQTKQRRFPRAAPSNDYDKFSAFRREIHIVQDDRLAIRFSDLFEPYPVLECCLAFHDGRCYVVYRGLPTVIRGNAFACTWV